MLKIATGEAKSCSFQKRVQRAVEVEKMVGRGEKDALCWAEKPHVGFSVLSKLCTYVYPIKDSVRSSHPPSGWTFLCWTFELYLSLSVLLRRTPPGDQCIQTKPGVLF